MSANTARDDVGRYPNRAGSEFRQLLKFLKFDTIKGMKAPLCLLIATIGSFVIADPAEKAAGTGLSFKGPIGLQMYSLRFCTETNALAKIDKARDLGFRA